MNRRDALNEVLLALNELPLDVSDNIEDIPTAVLVDKELEIARRKVLAYGWEFNTLAISFYPNQEGNIVVPNTYLSADGTVDNPEIIVRDWKVFDKENNTFKFTSPVTLDVIDDVVFDDIPFPIANYIVQVASLKSYIDIIGNTEDVALRRAEVQEARMEALRYDTRVSNTNVLDSEYSTTLLDMTSI